ncbi:MAG: c-type cytochrome [Rhodobacteraceae bacterium]|nr:c-type cytochrome [Paracoccaceae bacterium]
MNTMFFTKILGGVAGSLLILLLVKWAADAYYFPGSGHGDGVEAAYAIAVEDDGVAEEVVEVPFAELLAAADVNAGQRKFGKCAACHTIEAGANGIGPTLFEVVGREIGGSDFGNYSGNLPSGTWTPEELNAFLINPKTYAPGTSMNFSGFAKDTDRANVIAYLSSL